MSGATSRFRKYRLFGSALIILPAASQKCEGVLSFGKLQAEQNSSSVGREKVAFILKINKVQGAEGEIEKLGK